MVDCGELGTIGGKADGLPWLVGIQHPRREDAYIALAKLSGLCMATSGDYRTTFSADRKNHHIFNPATGHSPADFCSVTIVAPSATDADGLTKVVFVMGIEKAMKVIEPLKDIDVMFVTKDEKVRTTKGFPLA